jgi:hypothetical protein
MDKVHSAAEGGFIPTEKTDRPAGPDLATLWRDEQKGMFSVWIDVRARVRETVKAESEAHARAQVVATIKGGHLDLMADDIDEAHIARVVPEPTMYLVLRDDKEYGVSHPRPGDIPREPNKYEADRCVPPPRAAIAKASTAPSPTLHGDDASGGVNTKDRNDG